MHDSIFFKKGHGSAVFQMVYHSLSGWRCDSHSQFQILFKAIGRSESTRSLTTGWKFIEFERQEYQTTNKFSNNFALIPSTKCPLWWGWTVFILRCNILTAWIEQLLFLMTNDNQLSETNILKLFESTVLFVASLFVAWSWKWKLEPLNNAGGPPHEN